MNGYQEFYCKVLLTMHSSDKDVIHMAGREKDSVIIRMSELLTVTSWVEDRMLRHNRGGLSHTLACLLG